MCFTKNMNSLIGPTAAEQLAAEQLAKQHTTETLAKVTSVANLKRINEIDDATWCRALSTKKVNL